VCHIATLFTIDKLTLPFSAYEQAVKRADTFADILQGLFPSLSLDDIVNKPQSELLSTLVNHPPQGYGHTRGDVSLEAKRRVPVQSFRPAQIDDSTTMSDAESEAQERHWDETACQSGTTRAADDINAITLATEDHRRSYLGVASMSATFNAIFKLSPRTKRHLAAHLGPPSKNSSLPHSASANARDVVSTNLSREQRCISFYFETAHGITPLLDEDNFRATYAAGERQDKSWLALLNMVLALGSISSGSATLHTHYYNKTRSYLGFDCLGSGNLESLQALCLLGGFYLHYVNSPNMAYAVLGAAHRMAIALGLHRDPAARSSDSQPGEASSQHRATIELRRRVWWSLFCLDTWSGMTLGRPTCGRWDSDTMDTKLPTLLSPHDHLISSLVSSSDFCLIVHRMQERLAQFKRITFSEVFSYDQELQRWHESLPADLHISSTSLPSLRVSRQFMSDRYINARMMMYRCLMLYDAHDMLRTGNADHWCERTTTTGMSLAEEAIETITLHWSPSCFSVWSSTWYLFQACMVPLFSVSIATKVSQLKPDKSITILDPCRATLDKAQELFEELRPWMKSADRGPDVISGLQEGVFAHVNSFVDATTSDANVPSGSWATGDEGLAESSWESLLTDYEWLLDDDLYGF